MRTVRLLAAILLGTVATALLGLTLEIRWLLPLLNAAPAYAAMIATLRQGRRAEAIGFMIWWALCLALTQVTLSMVWNGAAEATVINGATYRDEMFSWLASGQGRESSPSQFIPQHLQHAGLFCLLSLVSGSAVSLVMGAVLMNYMSFYVGDLILQCAGTPAHATAVLLAWNPWSIIRVLSFIILGVVLAEPLLSRLRGNWPGPEGRWRWIGVAVAGLALDILLKTLLAPLWPDMFSACSVG